MFFSREEAGIRLALRLSKEKFAYPVIVSIPRGGAIVGKVVSDILKIPFFLLVVKKIGAPNNPELAIGAVGSAGDPYWSEDIVKTLKIQDDTRAGLLEKTRAIVREREGALEVKTPDVKNKTAIVVDDGVATGSTAIAASIIVKTLGAKRIVLATPLISKRTKKELSNHFEKIISVITPRDFSAVGQFYRDFPQVEDDEVRSLLKISN